MGQALRTRNANENNVLNNLPKDYFNIANADFTCPSASTLVYLTATGGNPGLTGTVNNTAVAQLVTTATRSSPQTLTSVSINEVTTVGAIAALYPYIMDHSAIGAANQANLVNAFALVNQYVNTSTGTVPEATLPAGSSADTPNVEAIAIDGSLRSRVISASYTLNNITPTVSLSNVTAPYRSTVLVTLTASSNANGSVVTFRTQGQSTGTFSPATCTIAGGSCSVSFIPAGTFSPGIFTAGLAADFAAAGSFVASSTASTLTVSNSPS